MVARSLRLQLVGWLVLPLAGVVGFNVWTTYENALETADLVTDRTLLASARVIAESIRQYQGVLEAPIPPAALEMFNSNPPDRVVYRVTTPRGDLIAGYPDIIAPPAPPVGLDPMYFNATFRDQAVRVVAIAQPIVAIENVGNAIVAVGQTLNGHDRLVKDLWLKALRDQALLVAIAGLLALFGLQRGLAPMMRLRERVVQRNRDVLDPLDVGDVQTELKPLVAALNDSFARVQQQIATQRRFVANAAHQLRNPLALAKTQVKVGLRAGNADVKNEALAGIEASVDKMNHLSNQLLMLARAEQGSALLSKEPVAFDDIARAALESVSELALERGIDLGFVSEARDVMIDGHSTLLRELVLNLAENAILYTPPGGMVTATLRIDKGSIILRIEDSGPGIPANERERVFERFYRRLESGGEGSGLGLAIAREIILAHGGAIALSDRLPPTGLVVDVTLPGL